MSPFRLELSEHAELRLKERGITRQMIRGCLTAGNANQLDVSGRLVRYQFIQKRMLVVVYIPLKSGYLIVTAYWKD